MGSFDRLFRIALATVAMLLFIKGFFFGTTAIIAIIVGGIFLATAIVGICPLYALFGIRTNKKSKK